MPTIDRNFMKAIRPEIDAALAELGARHGIKFSAAGGSYGMETGHFKLEMAVTDADAIAAKEKRDFDMLARSYGFEPSDYGLEFSANGNRYRFTGFETRRRKFPLRVVDVATGKPTLFGEMAGDRIRAARPKA